MSYFLPLAKQYDPLSVVVLLARKIDHKVRPNNGIQQQLISGSLSYIVMFGPLLLILGLLLSFAEFRVFFDCILLYIACSFSAQRKTYHKVRLALDQQKKMVARQWLSDLVKRQTSSLSNLGISKAAIEAIVLRFTYQVITPIFIFFIFGAIGALAYRIALECYWEWKRPFSEQAHYAFPVAKLCKIAQVLPMLFVCFLTFVCILPRNRRNDLSRERVTVSQPKISALQLQPLLFHILGRRLGISLGGPLQYQSTKQRLPKYGAPLQLILSDMNAVNMVLNVLTITIGFGLCSSAVIIGYLA